MIDNLLPQLQCYKLHRNPFFWGLLTVLHFWKINFQLLLKGVWGSPQELTFVVSTLLYRSSWSLPLSPSPSFSNQGMLPLDPSSYKYKFRFYFVSTILKLTSSSLAVLLSSMKIYHSSAHLSWRVPLRCFLLKKGFLNKNYWVASQSTFLTLQFCLWICHFQVYYLPITTPLSPITVSALYKQMT